MVLEENGEDKMVVESKKVYKILELYIFITYFSTVVPLTSYVLFPGGLGDLGVTCSPRDPSSAGSNPTEVDGFCLNVKILSTSPPGGT